MRMRSKSPEAVGAHYSHGSRAMHADKHSVQVPHKRNYDAYQKGQSSREQQMQSGRQRSRSQASHHVVEQRGDRRN